METAQEEMVLDIHESILCRQGRPPAALPHRIDFRGVGIICVAFCIVFGYTKDKKKCQYGSKNSMIPGIFCKGKEDKVLEEHMRNWKTA